VHPRSKQFSTLQAEWYKKLKDSGFNDIERKNGDIIHSAEDNIVTHYDQNSFEAKRDYNRLAGQFLHDYKFKSNLERLVWEHHVEGMSIRNIVKTLKAKRINVYKRKIHELLNRLIEEMVTRARKG